MSRALFLLLLFLPLAPLATAGPLHGHPSPYLALHADDPVAWRLWGEAALAEARASGKPLLVSSGFFTCTWCHVMQRESFRDPAIAALINRAFIPVKVDRELEPGLDGRLLDFVKGTRGAGGWPLNVVLTPEGVPLLGFVYLPPERLSEALGRFEKRWWRDPEALKRLAREGVAALEAKGERVGEGDPAVRLREALMAEADELAGGFGDGARFPHVERLRALLRLPPDEELEEFLRLTLEQMADHGLRDQLGGGFFRYTVDPDWREPHFEKLLVDNAQLARLYLEAAERFDEPRFAAVARQTLDFLLAEMRAADGGFIAALSAEDEAGGEGGYYLWRREELELCLNAAELAVLDLPAVAPFDAGHLLGPLPPELRRRLLRIRTERGLPRDEKRLTAWNALTLTALAHAARLPGGERYRRAGAALHRYLVDRLMEQGRPLRARTERGVVAPAHLADYALLAEALLNWHAVPGAAGDLRLVGGVIDEAWSRFHDRGRWLSEGRPLLRFRVTRPLLEDRETPSATTALIEASLELARLIGDEALAEKALQARARALPYALGAPLDHPGLLAAVAD